ncbi:MAG: lactate racemase domain-containing protein [Planctomycetota bacterium]|nr:lactate racemase domain-containing protein [Planctomycetota bacterium]MDA1211518.1 lactate racemase domain-containing protein [Planctomycetota bacterium]
MTAKLPILSDADVSNWFEREIPLDDFRGRRVLVIVPDATRTAPLELLFPLLYRRLRPVAQKLDVMVALGTHPPMPQASIQKMLGITSDLPRINETQLLNHAWDQPSQLTTLGKLTRDETSAITSGVLVDEVAVTINKAILDYDVLLVLGPVFPHEVVGFSGGNKYFFPGISGPELLNFFHWLGALITNVGIIGQKTTPVRQVVDRAASMIPQIRRCVAFVVNAQCELHGLSFGSPENAWNDAADLSAQVHIVRVARPFRQVLSCAPPMYDEVWVAGKCMYKLEPVVADGGELIIYAPHLREISVTHGTLIEKVGYHVRDYFTKQWENFKDIPWGVLAHSTHVRGSGTYDNGVEHPRVQVTLATQIPRDVCERINLGYRDPATINVKDFADREDEGILLVRKAGEQLYRLEQ